MTRLDPLRLTRRTALLGLAACPLPALAQSRFPDRPIRLIVPWTAGGPADTGFRIMADSVTRKLGQPVVVENKGQHRSLRAELCSPKLHGWPQHIENSAFWKVLVAA